MEMRGKHALEEKGAWCKSTRGLSLVVDLDIFKVSLGFFLMNNHISKNIFPSYCVYIKRNYMKLKSRLTLPPYFDQTYKKDIYVDN
jgi:hypothetical protein